jgi:hypothetical protein
MRRLCLAEEQIRSDRPACPRREPPTARESDWLPGPQTEGVSELVWDPKELDADLPVGWHPRIVGQALGPREPHVRPLRPRKVRRFEAALARRPLRLPHLEALIPQKPHAGSPMLSPAPVLPKKRRTSDGERVEKDTELARLCGDMWLSQELPLIRASPTYKADGAIFNLPLLGDAQTARDHSDLFQ